MHDTIRHVATLSEKDDRRPLIKSGKFFVPPPEDEDDFKKLFQRTVSVGAGRPVDKDGFPVGQWTPELLADAISTIDANPTGVELRTVQHWFQDNDKGISIENTRWLARIFGCNDPDATSQWQAALGAANRQLVEKRKEKRKAEKKAGRPSPQVVQGFEATTSTEFAPGVPTNKSIWNLNLAKRTEALLGSQSSLGLPIVIFSAATALGLIAFTLNIHSVFFTPVSGPAKQVGFLWAPNWTIVFLIILPTYLALLIDLLSGWKGEWRDRLASGRDPKLSSFSWERRVAAASYSCWAVLLITVVVASGYNWTATHLIPLLSGDSGGWPVDWGRIAIFRPDVISVPSAIVFTGLVFLYNAFCSYLFFAGLVLLYAMTQDYLDILKGLENAPKEEPHQGIEKIDISISLMTGVFRCMSLGMLITIMMKLQSSFLQSESENIIKWLVADIRSLFNMHGPPNSNYAGLRSAPGLFYSFFCVLAIFGTFMNASLRIRLALTRLRLSKTGILFHSRWVLMNGSMILLLASYLLIGAFSGFTIVLFFSLLLSVYLMIKPAFGQASATTEA